MPTTQTQRDIRVVPFWVFLSHMLRRVDVSVDWSFDRGRTYLCFWPAGVAMSSFTTMLNLRQKSSPRLPRRGSTVSSESPRMMGVDDANLTSREVAVDGRAKTGAIGTMGGCNGWGVLGIPPPCENSDISGEAGIRPSGVAVGFGRMRAETGAA